MNRMTLVSWSLLGLAVVAGPALSQGRGPPPPPPPRPDNGVPEATLFSGRNFQGSGYFMPRAQGDVRVAWRVQSIQMNFRSAWELCDQPQFRGRCVTFNTSTANMGPMTVRSARPISGVRPPIAPPPPPPINWTEVGRASMVFGRDRDVVQIRDDRGFREMQVCGERNQIRLRWVEARFRNGQTQRLLGTTTLNDRQCSVIVRLTAPPRQLSTVTIAYENRWDPRRGGTVILRAR